MKCPDFSFDKARRYFCAGWFAAVTASVAGVAKAAASGAIRADELVVAVLTGNGLKDPDTAGRTVAGRIVESDATEAGVRKALGW